MAVGLSGMISGMDTDSIVKAMVAAQKKKVTNMEGKITKNKWTTDAWSSLNKKIYSFYTKYASKLRLQSSYMTRTATSSNENIAKASASSTAAVGTHTLQVKELASSQYVTGAKISANANQYNKNTKLSELGTGVEAGTMITITGKKGTASEKTVKLEVNADTTVDDFLKSCKEAGLTASFDTTQQRFFISSSQSGKEDAFSITTSALSSGATNILNAITDEVNTSIMTETEQKNYQDAMLTIRKNMELVDSVLAADYDNANGSKAEKALFAAIETVTQASVKTYAHQTAEQTVSNREKALIDAGEATGSFIVYEKEYNYNDLRTTIENNVVEGYRFMAANDAMQALVDSGIELSEAYAKPENLTYARLNAAQETVDALTNDGKLNGMDCTNVEQLREAVESGVITEEEAEAIKISNTWNFTGIDGEGNSVNVQEIYQNAFDTKRNAAEHDEIVKSAMYDDIRLQNMDEYQTAVQEEMDLLIADEANTEIADLKALVKTNLTNAAAAGSEASASGISAMGLGEISGAAVQTVDANGDSVGMVVVEAANSKIVLDGATMEQNSNNFTVNGIHLDLVATSLNKATGEYDTIQISIGKDVDSTYNLVKEALKEYNALIDEMSELYYAKSARGYEPLTGEQKESMTEEDIKAWEEKIKNSLLRRDDSLEGLLSGMRTALGSEYTNEEGEKFSLSTFGIVTGKYTEYGKLHIYGDADDPTYATYTDRLKSALEENPDKVMDALTNIFGNLYNTMTEKCAKTEISSALTFYNDKLYKEELEDYEKDLDRLKDKMTDLEDRYYKQFSKMETSLSKLQSQTNSLASLLGTNTNQ